jgi:hypothetical protein
MRRALALWSSLLVALLLLASPAAARVLTLKFPRFTVPPHTDREVCNFVRLPGKKPMDIGGTIIHNTGGTEGFVSHHFLMWTYQGQSAATFPARSQIQNGEACLDFGPADRDNRLLIAGSQSVLQKQLLPAGLAQRLEPVDENGKPIIGLILNSHWINSSDRPHDASVKIKVFPARGKTKRFVQPIFDVFANAFLKVPPGTETPTRPVDWSPNPNAVACGTPGGSPLGGGCVPRGPACIVMLTAHMHKRGKLFTIDFLDGQNPARNVFRTESYSDPGIKIFDGQHGNPPPLLITPGQKLEYSCTHDNGATPDTPMKLGCQEVIPQEGMPCAADSDCGPPFGICASGTCTNVPGRSSLEALRSHEGFSGAAKRCTTDADCPASDAAYPDRQFTGKCVPANLVFGFTSDDDMCIMPGAYYDANLAAPAGQECNLDLL